MQNNEERKRCYVFPNLVGLPIFNEEKRTVRLKMIELIQRWRNEGDFFAEEAPYKNKKPNKPFRVDEEEVIDMLHKIYDLDSYYNQEWKPTRDENGNLIPYKEVTRRTLDGTLVTHYRDCRPGTTYKDKPLQNNQRHRDNVYRKYNTPKISDENVDTMLLDRINIPGGYLNYRNWDMSIRQLIQGLVKVKEELQSEKKQKDTQLLIDFLLQCREDLGVFLTRAQYDGKFGLEDIKDLANDYSNLFVQLLTTEEFGPIYNLVDAFHERIVKLPLIYRIRWLKNMVNKNLDVNLKQTPKPPKPPAPAKGGVNREQEDDEENDIHQGNKKQRTFDVDEVEKEGIKNFREEIGLLIDQMNYRTKQLKYAALARIQMYNTSYQKKRLDEYANDIGFDRQKSIGEFLEIIENDAEQLYYENVRDGWLIALRIMKDVVEEWIERGSRPEDFAERGSTSSRSSTGFTRPISPDFTRPPSPDFTRPPSPEIDINKSQVISPKVIRPSSNFVSRQKRPSQSSKKSNLQITAAPNIAEVKQKGRPRGKGRTSKKVLEAYERRDPVKTRNRK